jgi:hypothetical protein
MRASCFCVLALAVAITGCETIEPTYNLTLTNAASQTVRTNSRTGAAFIFSQQRNSIVALGLSTEHSWTDYGRAFDVKVKNVGRKPIQFGAAQIEVTADSQSIRVLDYAAIQQAIRDNQNSKEAAATFAAIAGGIGAGLYAGSRQANPALSSAMTQTVVSSVQASTVSLSRSKEEADVLSLESSKSFLTDVTIPPFGTVQGLVVVSQIAARSAEIVVKVGGDSHTFLIGTD